MPKKVEVGIDELLSCRKDISDDNGVIYKAHVAPRSWNDQERSAKFIMSAETEDSYRDVVVQSGIDIESRFKSNPVALFGHNSWATPIGSWEDVKRINGSPKRTEGKIIFTPEGVDDVADKVARHVSVGSLRASSIGFMPKAAERILDAKGEWTYGFKYLEIELYECSVVTVPAVREALVRNAGAKLEDIVSPEVIDEFLEHLKANPAISRMINRDLYDQIGRELGGNKTTIQIDAPTWMGEMRQLTERMERAVKTFGDEAETTEDVPEVDEVAKELEEGVERALQEVQPKIDDIPEEQVERRGAFSKLMDGIRGLIKGAEPEPPNQPEKANPDEVASLLREVDEIAARHLEAA